MKYRNWTAFLDERCAILQVSRRQASLDMDFAAGYLEGIEKGRFGASKKRCLAMAEYFGVDPNEILALAGFYHPPKETPIIARIISEVAALSTFNQRLILYIIQALKLKELSSRKESPHRIWKDDNRLCVDLPQGLDAEEVKELLHQALQLPK